MLDLHGTLQIQVFFYSMNYSRLLDSSDAATVERMPRLAAELAQLTTLKLVN